MERVLEGLHWKTVFIYSDYIIVFELTFEQELDRLSGDFALFRVENLKLSQKISSLFQREVQYLGHVVSVYGVCIDPKKVFAVKDWLVPTSVKELHIFLGFCSCYCRFVNCFAR